MLIGIDGNEANIKNRVGSNNYAYKILYWINHLDRENTYKVYLKRKSSNDLPIVSNNWGYQVLKPSFFWTRWRLPLDLYLRQPRPDIFFSPGHYAPKYCPVPLAVSIMDLSFLYYPEMFKTGDLYKLKKWTSEAIIKANHIFTISQFSKSDIIKNYNIPQEIITVTYPGYDQKLFNKEIKDSEINTVKSRYKIKGEYILYLGTIQPRKNITKLIKAFNNANLKNISLVISGKKGWHYKEVFKEADKKNMNKIIFTGYIKENEKPALIKGAKGLALVSLYEGFGIPVVEAMAVGTPTLVSDNSSLTEIVGDSGVIVDPKSVKSISAGITQVVHLNELERERNKISQKILVKKFNWRKTAKKTLEKLYELTI